MTPEQLAEHHEEQGALFARAACNNAPWYHRHGEDTARAANHFAVAASLRALASQQEERT